MSTDRTPGSRAVVIWAAGGPAIGMGHVSRCVHVASALSKMEVEVSFILNGEAAAADRVSSAGFPFINEGKVDRDTISSITAGVVVIDKKGDLSGTVRLIKETGRRVVLMDNYSADDADKVIIPYAAYRPDRIKKNYVAGRDYLIIGENFLQARARLERPGYVLPLKVLVTMGGSDPFNLTEMVLKALREARDIEVTAVIGPAKHPGKFIEEMEKEGGGGFKVVRGVSDLAPLMMGSHVAFTALGITVYELAYLGTPSILIGNYEDDLDDLEELQGHGICISLGFYKNVAPRDVRFALRRFVDDSSLWHSISGAARQLTDGGGARRVAGIIAGLIDAKNTERGA